MEITVECPKCKEIIDLSEAVVEQIEKEIKAGLEKQIEDNLAEKVAVEMDDLKQQLKERDRKLKKSRDEELSLRKKQRELEDKIDSFDLEVARKLDEEREEFEKSIRIKLSEEFLLKDKTKDKQLEDLKSQINDLKQKAELGSQQLQGEVAELSLEEQLICHFPLDEIKPVEKGVTGADVLQKVFLPGGQFCGTIIWESKNTKNWNNQWIAKLKDDQIAAKAEIAILASTALPDDVIHFADVDGVWVTNFSYIVELAIVLRENLIQLNKTRLASIGKDDKMEMIYNYLSGQEFRQRINAMVEAFIALKDELEGEKRSMQRIWAKREKQISRVVNNIAGMYGDMQGIIALPEIDTLLLPENSEN